MKLAIMQPYFFPYIGYISMIKHTDKFILFDTVQFIRHGWIERNRILRPDKGWQYIQVPLVKFQRETKIKDVEINNDIKWKEKILAQIEHYKRKAPHYYQIIKLLEDIFSSDYKSIVELDRSALLKTIEYLGFKKDLVIFSKTELKIEKANEPDEWALNICNALGNIDEYWNPPGGMSFFDRTKYERAKINLKFHSIVLTEYNQKRNIFEPGLSIIDVMMFNDIDKINKMLDKYELY